MEKYQNSADFVIVYISEAHPAEKKHYQSSNEHVLSVKSHANLEDRIEAAEMLREKIGHKWPLLVDDMDDAANALYGASPERIYAIQNGTVVFEGQQGPYGFDLDALEDKLKELVC